MKDAKKAARNQQREPKPHLHWVYGQCHTRPDKILSGNQVELHKLGGLPANHDHAGLSEHRQSRSQFLDSCTWMLYILTISLKSIASSTTLTVIGGGCLCGSIRYEATGQPYNVTHCHCADCRGSSGAPFVTWASFPRSGFRFTKGQPRELSWAGRLRSFCPHCGTPLTFLARPDAEEIDVTVCSFDEPAAVTPADQIWVDDRLPRIALADNLPRYAQKRQAHST